MDYSFFLSSKFIYELILMKIKSMLTLESQFFFHFKKGVIEQLGISMGGAHIVSAKREPHCSFTSFNMRRDSTFTI